MSNQISVQKAVTLYLGETWEKPVATDYDLATLLFHVYENQSLGKARVEVKEDSLTLANFRRAVLNLQDIGILTAHKNFDGNVYLILGRTVEDPADLICAVDPFAYVSHLTAMAFFGITDRIPRTVYYSTPAPPLWRHFAQERMLKDLGDGIGAYRNTRLPKLTQITPRRVDGYAVNRYLSVHRGAFKIIRGRNLRVSTIGRTFLDMVREPHRCGGIRHVMQVYREHGEQYLELLVNEIDRHGKAIEKVRAGYILEEQCGLEHETISSWERFAQRGGSRKLDPTAEYDGVHFSKKWSLSVNV